MSNDSPADASSTSVPGSDVGPEKQKSPFRQLLDLDPVEATDEQIQQILDRQVAIHAENSGLLEKFNILVLHDEATLGRSAANRIYSALDGVDRSKPILLVLNTPGGDVAAAYFVAKLCREHTHVEFHAAVPRRAKSAGTLICCGADRIHMGSLSELGPIDPQFGATPALALKHSIEHIAELVSTYPNARQMFSDYLARSLRVESLGFFERVAESASQYAIRLLDARMQVKESPDTTALARHLVYSYKDHGFVIDSREATELFGPSVIVCNTEEYRFSNSVYESLDLMAYVCDARFSRRISYIGNTTQGCWVVKKDDE